MKRTCLFAVLLAAAISAQAENLPEDAAPCPDPAVPKLAFVFEGAQWNPHLAAVRRVTEQLGAAACVRTFDHLNSGVDPDANARFLLGSLGLQHYAVVFLLTPRHAEAVDRVVRQFPDTTYLQLDGKAHAVNLIPYRLDVEEAGQLAGAVAASKAAGGRVAYAFGAGVKHDAAWARGLSQALQRPPEATEPMQLEPAQLPASGAAVLAVSGASVKELRALRRSGASVVAWNAAQQGVSGKDTLRLWADWAPFYRSVAECVIAGRRLTRARVEAGAEEGVITGDEKVLASAAWRRMERRRAPALCP